MNMKAITDLEADRVLVTGVCGTVGSRLLQHLAGRAADSLFEVLGVDFNENGVFELEQIFERQMNVRLVVGDVRDRLAMERLMQGVDIVFHCAALKHVYQCEKAPDQAVDTNISGVQSVILAALRAGVKRVIFTSSDKAVNPTSVMGTSKLMGERLITAANASAEGKTVFASTRFGNVLGSNGSVINVFRRQIQAGGPITLTSDEMTRFVMGIDQAVELIVRSVGLAQGGEVFITKMPVVAIRDLATVMREALAPLHGLKPSDIEIALTGPRPGEKLFEELMTEEETRRASELRHYFVILPAFRPVYSRINYHYPDLVRQSVTRAYASRDETPMSASSLRELLGQIGILT